MALRIGPPPALARLRVHWYAAHNDYMRRSRAIAEMAARNREILHCWWRAGASSISAQLSGRSRALARRKASYGCFVDRYEQLVEVLCWAAKDGDHTDRDARYACVRQWMQLNYHKFRPELRTYLGTWDGPLDPFEELFAPECIDDVINDTDAITNFMRTRAALEAYQDAKEIA